LAKALKKADHQIFVVAVAPDDCKGHFFHGSGTVFDRLQIEYHHAGPKSAFAQTATNLVKNFEPDLLIVGTNHDPSGLRFELQDHLVAACKTMDKPVLQFVDSWEVWHPRKSERGNPPALVVPDSLTKKIVLKRGFGLEHHVYVTGNPNWLPIEPLSKDIRAQKRGELGITEAQRLITYFTGFRPDDETTLDWVMREMNGTDKLLLRRHPRDRRDYQSLLSKYQDRIIFDPSLSSNFILGCTDVCITHYSTLGLLAALSGIATINIILPGDCDELCDIAGGYPLAVMGGSVQVGSQSELGKILKNKVGPVSTSVARVLKDTDTAVQKQLALCTDLVSGRGKAEDLGALAL